LTPTLVEPVEDPPTLIELVAIAAVGLDRLDQRDPNLT
jgi:hypothetical protein